MNSPVPVKPKARSADEAAIVALYERLLECWNRRDAQAFAAAFEPDGHSVGFDGSPLDGREQIESTLREIFAHHPTAAYVAKIREVGMLAAGVGVVRAVVGMIPPGKTDLNPAVNAIQSMVATRHDGGWRIALLQNTPAQFHGRPEMVEALTEELRQLLAMGANE